MYPAFSSDFLSFMSPRSISGSSSSSASASGVPSPSSSASSVSASSTSSASAPSSAYGRRLASISITAASLSSSVAGWLSSSLIYCSGWPLGSRLVCPSGRNRGAIRHQHRYHVTLDDRSAVERPVMRLRGMAGVGNAAGNARMPLSKRQRIDLGRDFQPRQRRSDCFTRWASVALAICPVSMTNSN